MLQTLLSLRARRRDRRSLARDRRRPRLLRNHQANPQRPVRLPWRRRRAGRRRSDATSSTSSGETPTSCVHSFAPATWSSSTILSLQVWWRAAKSAGARVVWRCHVGLDRSERVERAVVGVPAPLPDRRGRDRRLPRRLRAAVDRSRAGARDSALDRPLLREERGALDLERPADALLRRACSKVRARRRPRCRSPGATARPGRINSARRRRSRRDLRHPSTLRSSCRSHGGTG